jgi:hypothetical protein
MIHKRGKGAWGKRTFGRQVMSTMGVSLENPNLLTH